MLPIHIKGTTFFNEETSEFIEVKDYILQLEHSLVSLQKWEQKWHVPFLSSEKTPEQIADYVKCMTLSKNVDPNIYLCITREQYEEISNYINDPMTATWFKEDPNKPKSREIVTAEIIYYWMISLQIPCEFKKWHLNSLLTLIHVCNEKNQPEKKMSKNEILKRNKALNEARRAKYKSKG